MKKTITADGNEFRLEGEKTCPKCQRKRPMSKFGMRKMSPTGRVYRPQSWCVDCRSPSNHKRG